MIKIGVLSEDQNSNIAVLIPHNIKQLKNQAEFYIQKNTGLTSGYTDRLYEEAGAKILSSRDELINQSDIVLSFNPPLSEEVPYGNKTFIGAYDVLNSYHANILPFQKNGVNVFSLNLLPRTTIAQSMDILSSMSSMLGYKAVIIASTLSPVTLPMITGAGGTLKPANVLVLGAGVAGLQAIATAKRLGAIVKAFDVRKVAKIDVESLGAQFIDIEGAVDQQNAGGYAVEQEVDYLQKIEQVLFEEAVKADIIITTAKIPGKKAPLLITKKIIDNMKNGAVIIDLAADTGGNSVFTKKDETITTKNGVVIVGDTN
ncbi:MAG: NAD(P) transhydrogenase subunit alpha, partial [Flavobacteriales bacterium]|nr:NAD(P) transhydrogenase subunit alpha [Flavobacteriales bacterium]